MSQDEKNMEGKFRFVSKINSTHADTETGTAAKIEEKIIKDHTGYEVLYGAVIPYYDWEKYYDTEEIQQEKLSSDIRESYDMINSTYNGDNGHCEILSFMSCGYDDNKKKYKNSFHYRVRGAGYHKCGADLLSSNPGLFDKEGGFDKSVYKQVGKRQLLRLPYCSKSGQDRQLKRVLIDDDDIDVIKKLEDCKLECFENLGDYLVQNIKKEKLINKSFINNTFNVAPTVPTSEVGGTPVVGTPVVQKKQITATNVEQLLECLNIEEQEWEWDYWTKIIWGLRNISDENNLNLRDLAHTVSRYSSKYDKNTTDSIYDAKEKNPPESFITMGTLIKFAKQTNPKMYLIWKENLTKQDLESKFGEDNKEAKLLNSAFTDGDVSDYVVSIWGENIRVDGDDIYRWDNHYWLKSDVGMLEHLLDTDCYKKLKYVVDTKYDKAEDFKKYITLLGNVNSLRNVRPRTNYVKAIVTALKNTQEKSDFDMNPDLLCFKNGVYDLASDEFRDGRKNDYCSQIVPYEWSESSSADKEKLMQFIDKIMPHEDERDCLLTSLSSALGGRLLENVLILTGKGRNGKDTLISGLLNATLGGDIYYNNSTSVLTQNTKGGISQEKANMHKKRCVVYAEPSKDEPLKCANLKEITGCPTLTGRGIYSKTTTIQNFSTTIIHTNAIPELDTVDEAIANRLVIFPFRSLFRTQEKIDEYPPDTENLHLVDSYYKSGEFLEENKLVFLNILLSYYKKFKQNKYLITNIPATMRELAKAYMVESDDFVNWFYTEYELTTSETDIIKLKDVYSLYRMSDLYQNLNKKDKRKNNYSKMTRDIEANPNIKPFYRARLRNMFSVLLKHKKKIDEVSDDEDE
jgi:phage/plasmid-associated DNA primase